MKLNRLLCAVLAAVLLLVLSCAPALAKVVSASKEFYYLDEADVLSEATEGEIFFSNELLSEACGAQIVVVALDTTGNEAIDDYAYELINDWGIGDKARQNGFLLLLAIDDDDYYAVCGTGLQSKLTSGVLNRFFDDYLETDFAAKRYDAGVKKFFEAVFAYVADVYGTDVTTAQGVAAYEAWAAEDSPVQMAGAAGGGSYEGPSNQGNSYDPQESDSGLGSILLLLIVIFMIVLIVRGRRRRTYTATGGGTRILPIIFSGNHRTPPPPPTHQGPFVGNRPGPGGYRGSSRPFGGLFGGGSTSSRPFGGSTRPSGGVSRPSGGSSRPSGGGSLFGGSSRPSGGGSIFGGSSRSSGGRSGFGSARGGGGGSRGGGAGRGRH